MSLPSPICSAFSRRELCDPPPSALILVERSEACSEVCCDCTGRSFSSKTFHPSLVGCMKNLSFTRGPEAWAKVRSDGTEGWLPWSSPRVWSGCTSWVAGWDGAGNWFGLLNSLLGWTRMIADERSLGVCPTEAKCAALASPLFSPCCLPRWEALRLSRWITTPEGSISLTRKSVYLDERVVSIVRWGLWERFVTSSSRFL